MATQTVADTTTATTQPTVRIDTDPATLLTRVSRRVG